MSDRDPWVLAAVALRYRELLMRVNPWDARRSTPAAVLADEGWVVGELAIETAE